MLAVLLLHGCDLENAMNLLARSEGQLRKALERHESFGFALPVACRTLAPDLGVK